jgi:hypothetical protein
MNVRRILLTAVLCFGLLTSTAMADYQPDQDKTIAVQILPGVIQPSGETGAQTFALQEGLHQTVTSTTGISVPHFYFWVTVNGQPVAAVDPMCAYSYR